MRPVLKGSRLKMGFGDPRSGSESVGTGKRGHYERGLFAGGISRISITSKFSRISGKQSDSPSFSTVRRFSEKSKFSGISRKSTFLQALLFQKTPFSGSESV